ncbi:Signal transduction histidine kinase [Anaerovirgula multivorans]|uniref:histidine kinase n=1 Tax=Anaerovirgula multivorans TaxID=312168 RepID=A0A239F8L8_9FIRM|nr:HAMP domain-containing sensor histidine kinase [Anaerovirgula multivorans]SNS53091.1 Signal transduction histidine kinase [Anaerovirgula multivorans]
MRYSIQYKILIPFILVIFIGMTSLLFVSYNINEQNTLQVVEKDMIGDRKSLDLYLRQYFLINNLELNKISLEAEAEKLSKGLSAQIGSMIEINSLTGKSGRDFLEEEIVLDEDFLRALLGETAYTINNEENRVIVTLSYPIELNQNIIGIMRSTKDYTELFNYNRRFNNVINYFAIAIFVLIFLTSFYLSRQLTKPIRQLIKGSEQISTGDYDLNININSPDEIGELADRFKFMAQRIKEQIKIIQGDRDKLKEVQAQSKVFFDNVTHELKTPLTTIMGYAQVLKENGFSDKDFFDKGTSYIINESKRLNKLVIEILELSKTATMDFSYHYEKVNLSELIAETCDEMKMKGKKYNIAIHYSLQKDLFLKGDRNKLKEVLINLLDNAIKYGRVNSSIDVDAYRQDGAIILKIKDQGEGISEKHINKIFEPFYRISSNTSKEKGSAGLGLTIVKNIIENHRGTIDIKSKLNEGTVVIIVFGGEGNI